MILVTLLLTISVSLGNLQKEFNHNDINQTNKLLNTFPPLITTIGREGRNEYPFYRPLKFKTTVDHHLKLNKKDESEQFEYKEDNNVLESDKTTEEHKYELTSSDSDLRRSKSKQLKDVDGLELRKSRMMIFRRPRVCYACSSINDPSCWYPSNRTIVKYCREPEASCVKKTFEYEGRKHVIRDCGSTCTDKTNLEPDLVYKLCETCQVDLCNSAYSVKVQIFTILFFILFNIVYSY